MRVSATCPVTVAGMFNSGDVVAKAGCSAVTVPPLIPLFRMTSSNSIFEHRWQWFAISMWKNAPGSTPPHNRKIWVRKAGIVRPTFGQQVPYLSVTARRAFVWRGTVPWFAAPLGNHYRLGPCLAYLRFPLHACNQLRRSHTIPTIFPVCVSQPHTQEPIRFMNKLQ